MHVVELADNRLSGQCHFGKDRPRETVVVLGIESSGSLVHDLAPCPERAAAGLGSRAKRPVEGMAVGVRKSGDGQAVQSLGIGRCCGVGDDAGEPAVAGSDCDARVHDAADRCELAPPVGQDPTRSTNSMMRSTNASRW